MVAFATVRDLEDRFRPLAPSEVAKAEALLADASMFIRAEMDEAGRAVDDADPEMLKAVACFVAKRAMGVDGSGMSGLSSYTETTGPFSAQMSFSNPSGDLYLTKAERRWLGISGTFARCAYPGGVHAAD